MMKISEISYTTGNTHTKAKQVCQDSGNSAETCTETSNFFVVFRVFKVWENNQKRPGHMPETRLETGRAVSVKGKLWGNGRTTGGKPAGNWWRDGNTHERMPDNSGYSFRCREALYCLVLDDSA